MIATAVIAFIAGFVTAVIAGAVVAAGRADEPRRDADAYLSRIALDRGPR